MTLIVIIIGSHLNCGSLTDNFARAVIAKDPQTKKSCFSVHMTFSLLLTSDPKRSCNSQVLQQDNKTTLPLFVNSVLSIP